MADDLTRRTALFEAHLEAGARMVEFAGWEMPVQYTGVRAESLGVRQGCGLFDVSHMGQISACGPNVGEALNRVVSADWSKVGAGRASYALLLNENGGVLDDIMGYHLSADHWLVVANASRAHVDEAFLRRHLPPEIEISNRYENQAMIAIQGPSAQVLLDQLCDADLETFAFRDVRASQVLGEGAIVARGGYTGCDGFEWMGSAQIAPILWRKLIESGAVPCGLGARDVLRLESGLPLYGHEMSEETSPEEAGLLFAVKIDKGPFVGRSALLARRSALEEKGKAARVLRGLKMEGRAIPREGYAVQSKGEAIGVVTSGTLSPTLDIGIALARLDRDLAVDTSVDIVVRGVPHPARVVPLPFVPRTTKSIRGAVSGAPSGVEKSGEEGS